MIRKQSIKLGLYELARNSRGEPVLSGKRGVGRLAYSKEHPQAGPFRLLMPLPARYGHIVDAADFTKIRSKSARNRITVHYQKPMTKGVVYDIRVVYRISLSAERD